MLGTPSRPNSLWRNASIVVVCFLLGSSAFAAHTGFVESVLSGKCLDVFNDSTANGADVGQWTCNGGTNQTILFTPTASTPGMFTMRFEHSNKCLEVAGGSTSSGANIVQNNCDGGTNQQFQLVAAPNNLYEIMPRHSGLRVSLASASSSNGVSLIQSTDVNGDHQRWLVQNSDTRDPAVYGSWGPVIPWPHIAVSAANLPDGRILTFSGSERETWPSNEFTYSATFDPLTGEFVEIDHQTHNMFCAHLAMTEDGQVFVNGGRNQTNSPWTSLFDYSNNQWNPIENMASGGRWYPTTLALTDGDIFTAIGTASNERNPERYDARTGWKVLTGIDFQTPVHSYQSSHGEWRWWPLLHLAPQGKIFHSGPTPTVGWINTTGNGTYEDSGQRIDGWYHKHGTTIMYDEGKILTAGGWINGGNVASTNQAFTVDLNGPVPDVQLTDSMAYARKFHNGVMLPNGEVLVVGGNTSGQKFNDSGTVYDTEIWNPNSGTWRISAAGTLPRNYHSVALLLPDARVLSAGGGYCSGSAYCSGSSHRDGQIYSPAYLFNPDGSPAPRPSITNAPGLIQNGSVFDVQTSGSVAGFSMIKMGATTHGMNTDVRFLPVDSQNLGGGNYRLTVNGNPNVLSPGYWLVFALGTNGAPSIAHTVRVTNKDVMFENIALFGAASQSSTYIDGGLDFSPFNAIDGDMTGTDSSGSITHTDDDTNAWWELDLHSVYDIDSIRLWNRTDCCSNRLSNFYVLVSDDPFVSTDLAASRAQTGVSEYFVNAAVDNQLDLDIARTGRFVRVQLAGTDFLSLAEVQLFGELPGAGSAGLVHYDYYSGSFDVLPDFSTLTPVRSGTVDGFNLSPATATDNFAIRYYGKIAISQPGNYTFYTTSDDGSRLYIDGAMVVDNDGLHGAVQAQGTVNLAAGSHDIEVTFFEKTGGQVLTVEYSGPGFSQQAIPLGALSLLPPPSGAGTILREYWTGIPGTGIAALTGDADYPDSPDGNSFPTSFEAPTSFGDDYGTRMRGMLEVPFSGNYTFWIASDDQGELWLSTDDNSANAQLIANVPSWSASREWDKFPEQQSSQIYLQSGQRYYIEALQKEGGGGDNLAVAWETPFASRAVIDGGYLSPPFETLQILGIGAPPQVVTSPVTMTATASGDGVQYSWSFGDGTPDTIFDPSSVTNHTYASPGRYTVTLTVQDSFGNQDSVAFQQLVHGELTTNRPNASGSIVFHDARAEVWHVNPDNDSVTVIDANNDVRIAEIPVADEPRGLTVAADGRVWVTSKASATLSVIDPSTQQVVATLPLRRGSQPHGIVAHRVDPDVYVALEGTGDLLHFNALNLNQLGSTNLGEGIRQLSVDSTGGTLLVARFVTPAVPGESTSAPSVAGIGGEVLRVQTSTLTVAGTTFLQHSDRLASEHTGPGLPNYLQTPVISPDGDNAWITSKQDNILRGMLRDGSQLTHDHTVRAISSRILLPSGTEQFSSRIDHDNASIGSATAFGPYGVHLFTALEGNRQVAVSDAFFGSELIRFDVGRAPQGLAVSPSGNKLYVHNFMDRSVSVVDISNLTGDGSLTVTPLATIDSTSSEALTAQILLGKQHFYDARDSRLALESYMACASCHNAGGQDGRIWDFTGVGEGLRNTVTLEGHGVHGMLHWTGNFDEVQDFENQIRDFSGGTGLMTDPDFDETEDILGTPKAGRSADLDALAAYVTSLIDVPNSPHRDTAGNLTPAAESGLQLFQTLSCDSCHTGLILTDSTTGARHDVGTIRTSSGDRLGGTLDGFDTPSLVGIWNTAPYLHDGSADDIEAAILAHTGHENRTQTELDQLVAFLQQAEIGVADSPCGPGGTPGPDDNCNGIDDDCDGLIDDDYVGGLSSCGVGECAGNTGLQECAPVIVYGSNRDGDMVELNLNDSVDAQIDSLAFGTQAMELDFNTGRIYYYEWQTSADEFGYWDPTTGQNVVVRTYSPGLGFYGKRMAQHPNGTMYLSDGTENLYTIDLANGDVTLLGAMTGLEAGSLGATGDFAFAPDGTLYIVNYKGLSTLNLGTLQATLLADNLLNLPGIHVFTGVAYCHGQIYASDIQEATGRSSILRIDPETYAIEELWLTGDYLNDMSSCPSDGTPPVESNSCDPFAGATAEICDGLDNDCDGETDEEGVCNECFVDADCDDSTYCNGTETCQAGSCVAGTPVDCDDGVSCTTDSCDEGADSCLNTPVDSVCDDGTYCNGSEICDPVGGCSTGSDPCPGLDCDEQNNICIIPDCTLDADCDDGSFCNGAETCNAGTCQAGTPVICDDGIACTTDSCNEGTDSCDATPVDSVCDDGAFCNGAETCNASVGCEAAADPDPCDGDECDESNDVCIVPECVVDADCNDGTFCNGSEVCNAGSCEAGIPVTCDDGVACTADSCNEGTDSCDFTPVDSVCSDGSFCNGAEVCDPLAGCQPSGIDPCDGAECDEVTDTCDTGLVPAARLESGTVSAGGSAVTVNLVNEYVDPVIVTSSGYTANSLPIVTRVGNVTGSSFTVRLQNPSGAAVSTETIHYLVVEAGAWEVDGVRFEAQKYTASITSNAGSWVPEAQNYLQSYSDPVVIGQVMSENDPGWSVFWSQGNVRSNPPSASDISVGKTTMEDGTTRVPETVGFIVFETTHGFLGGVEFEAGETPDSILGIGDSPPYNVGFDTSFAASPQVAVVTMAAVDGGNGGWMVLHGNSPLSASSMNLALDEDQIYDAERNHVNEQAHYVSFATAIAYEPVPECNVDGDCDDGQFCNGVETCTGGACQSGSDPCNGDVCDEANDICIAAPGTQLESMLVTAGSSPSTVNLANSYVEPVVVCTVQYNNNSNPVVTRVANATANSFQLRLQSPAGASVANDTVHCLVVEAGTHSVGGLTIEAQRFTSTITDENNSWVAQSLGYLQSYNNPVILGQVMTENDPLWSAFWSRGNSRSNVPSPTDLRVGKMVAEDPVVPRADETLGVIVIEAAHGSFGGVEFEAELGTDTIAGVDNGPPFAYSFQAGFSSAPQVVIATMSAMDGNNGGWAQLHGPTAATSSQLFLSIDEDTINDSERAHTSEQVSYIAFETEFVYP